MIRTPQQNSAIHKYFQLLAEALNDAGYEQNHPVFDKVSSTWTAHSVKEKLFKPILEARSGKKSTAAATTVEISDVHKVLDYWTSTKTGIHIGFPDRHGSDHAEIEKQSPGTFSAISQDEGR